MRSPLFRRLAATAFLLIGITLAGMDYVLRHYLRELRVNDAQTRLTVTGGLISRALSRELDGGSAQASLSGWCNLQGSRIDLLDADGGVLAGCTGIPGTRPIGAEDVTARVPFESQKKKLVLLLSEPVEVDRSIRLQVAGMALAASSLALMMAYLVAERIARKVSQLKVYADALLDTHNLDDGIVGTNDELGALDRTLHRVAAQLRELFERWSLESSRSEAILSGMAEGVLAVDPELRVVFCNNAVVRAMGVRTPIKERTPVLEFMRDTELVDILRRVVSSGGSIRQNVKLSRVDGRAFEVQAAPFATAGGKGALAIFYDTTDLERLEQVRKDFVANVSHEMRTPLAAIVGYSDTLLDGGLEDSAHNRKFVEVIRANAVRLNSIASDLLVLSELESGNSPGEPECVSVRDVLENAVSGVESEARSRQVRVLRGPIDDARVLGHRFRLEQAMLNLLVNAVKFNREGGEVRVEARTNGDRHIRIAVSDTGVGIPSQDLPRIFERFYRVDKARSRQVGGTGLGLSIVRHVIERMDGTIEVESQLGKGSTFSVILPVC